MELEEEGLEGLFLRFFGLFYKESDKREPDGMQGS